MLVNVEINNMKVKEGYGEPFIVARLTNGQLWYYGRYNTQEEAEIVVENLNDAIFMEVAE